MLLYILDCMLLDPFGTIILNTPSVKGCGLEYITIKLSHKSNYRIILLSGLWSSKHFFIVPDVSDLCLTSI